MKKAHITIIILVVLFTLAFLLFPVIPQKNGNNIPILTESSVKIGNTAFNVTIVSTPQERKNGLSGKELLPLDNGMLFVFEKSGIYPFWMKNMNFPIDIIWIGLKSGNLDDPGYIKEDLRVVYIEKDATPESFPEIFIPDIESIYVLEVNSGVVEEKKIKIGDEVFLGI